MTNRKSSVAERGAIRRVATLPRTSIGAGVDVRTVAGRLGHSDPSMTLRVYAQVIEERDRAAADIFGRVLAPAAASRELEPG